MAITPLGNEYKGLEFDGVSSKTYGVMIYGEGVFNAPERDVEMIKIPGRSGTFALDKGRFENIEVTYPARLIADNTADFAAAISDFRNELCSRRGYV
jgi:phage-related protein